MASSAAVGGTAYESVLKFWIPEDKSVDEKIKLWFRGGPETDKLLKEKFGKLVLQARNGELSHWEDLSEGTYAGLAYIILIDQFCRSIYRGTADQFSHDGKALAVALKLIESGKDKDLSLAERLFVYLPIEHCESLDNQKLSVKLFNGLVGEASGSELADFTKVSLQFAEQHYEIISKFGRFPRRNAALGRESTPEEIECLNNWPYMW